MALELAQVRSTRYRQKKRDNGTKKDIITELTNTENIVKSGTILICTVIGRLASGLKGRFRGLECKSGEYVYYIIIQYNPLTSLP